MPSIAEAIKRVKRRHQHPHRLLTMTLRIKNLKLAHRCKITDSMQHVEPLWRRDNRRAANNDGHYPLNDGFFDKVEPDKI